MKNKYEIKGDYVEIYFGKDNLITTIDLSDLEKVKKLDYIEPNGKGKRPVGVIWRNGKKRRILLYRYILDASKRVVVDHIDNNPFNNRRSNLRFVNKSGNGQNRKGPNANSKTGIRNVYYDPTRKKCWLVQLKLNGKRVYAKRFESKEEAIRMAKLKRAELFPYSKEALELNDKIH